MSSVNTNSANRIHHDILKAVAGDKLTDAQMEEISRRLVATLDDSAISAARDIKKVAMTQTVSGDALKFSWPNPFGSASYQITLTLLSSVTNAVSFVEVSRTLTSIEFNIVGRGSDTPSVRFTAFEL